jgi:hypothetical protein
MMLTAAVLPAFGFLYVLTNSYILYTSVPIHTYSLIAYSTVSTYVHKSTHTHTYTNHNGMSENLYGYTLGVPETILG